MITMPLLFILIIGTVMICFWDFVRENVEVIGSLATSLAFLATAWAAYEARHSAKAAMKATQLTAASLIEMKKNSFKQWFELLLEQHDKMLVDVNQAINDDSELKTKLNMNMVKVTYYYLTKKPVLIKYINHIIFILSYIDKEFYDPSSASDEKKAHIEQLRNSINSEVHLIIAIFGLNIDNNKTYDARKLTTLLNEFDFFENTILFKEAMSKVHFLNEYVADIFRREYQGKVEYYVDEMVGNYQAGIKNPEKNISTPHQRITFPVIWSYNNPCQQFLLERFNDLPKHMEERIKIAMARSFVEVYEFESKLSDFVGWELQIKNKKSRIIKNKNQIYRLINICFKYDKGQEMTDFVLFHGYAYYADEIRSALSDYALKKAYSSLNSDPRQKEIIDGVVSEVEKYVITYKSELDNFKFK